MKIYSSVRPSVILRVVQTVSWQVLALLAGPSVCLVSVVRLAVWRVVPLLCSLPVVQTGQTGIVHTMSKFQYQWGTSDVITRGHSLTATARLFTL